MGWGVRGRFFIIIYFPSQLTTLSACSTIYLCGLVFMYLFFLYFYFCLLNDTDGVVISFVCFREVVVDIHSLFSQCH